MQYLTTEALVVRYNSTRRLALSMPRNIRCISMTGAGGTLQLMLDELQRRAVAGDNQLNELDH